VKRSYIVLVSLSSALWMHSLFAGGTLVNGVGAKGAAMQAFVAVADDPSAVYYNPAGLTQIHKKTAEGGADFMFPDLKYKNSTHGVRSRSARSAVGFNAFYVQPLPKKWWFGVGLYAPYARISRYQSNAAVASPLGSAKQSGLFLRMDLAPTLAYELNQKLSLGVSAVLSYGKTESDAWGLKENGDGYGVTGQVGLLWKVTPALNLGIDYRGPEQIHMDGHGASNAVYPGVPVNGDYTTDVRYPGVFSVGAAWRINVMWLASVEYDNEMWSYLNKAKRDYSNTTVTNTINGKNSSDYRLGFAFTPNVHHAFYAGYSYVEATTPAVNISPAQPDYTMDLASVGYSYRMQQWQFDVTYEHTFLQNRKSNSAAFPGDYYGHMQHVLLDAIYRWK
jgi:long-chain fatty acid transport protein